MKVINFSAKSVEDIITFKKTSMMRKDYSLDYYEPACPGLISVFAKLAEHENCMLAVMTFVTNTK